MVFWNREWLWLSERFVPCCFLLAYIFFIFRWLLFPKVHENDLSFRKRRGSVYMPAIATLRTLLYTGREAVDVQKMIELVVS